MRLEEIDFRFAYSFCSNVQRAVFNDGDDDPEAPGWYLPENAEAFILKAATPHRETLLHHYIYEVEASSIDYEIGHGGPEQFIEFAPMLEAADLEVPDWLACEAVVDHLRELEDLLQEATRRLVPAAFHILYTDLRFLHQFQRIVAARVRTSKVADHPTHLRRDGVLQRPQHWPGWLRKGVFHRDKGRCQECQRDLTGTVLIEGVMHIDHILPLAQGGTNDPTNLQLLCDECNLRKGTGDPSGNWRTQTFW
jgi:5-methylcytosine-specific restriction endonuclease McrA